MGTDTPDELKQRFEQVREFDFFFIDEAHNLTPKAQESLFPLIDGDTQKSCAILLATNQPGKLLDALGKRMALSISLNHYPLNEMRAIVDRLAVDLDLLISPQASTQIAKISNGLPRKAKQHLQNLRRSRVDAENRKLSVDDIRQFLQAFDIDQLGLELQDRRYLRYLKENQPHPILGAMCLKVLKVPHPQKSDGKPYSAEEIDFFWSRMHDNAADLPPDVRHALDDRRPSPQLQRSVMRLCGRAGAFTLTGRLRANATYAARHNTIFQGLAADGAKLALWKLWRAGYRIVNFIHDEVLVEVPVDSNLTNHAENIRRLMIEGMQEVVSDVLIKVEYAAMDRWHKDAVATYDEHAQLQVYNKSAAGTAAPSLSTPNDPGTSGQIGVPTCTAALGVDKRYHVTNPPGELAPPMELEHPFDANVDPHVHGMPQLHCSGESS